MAIELELLMQIVERGCALLGYVPIGNIGMLLLATRLRTAAVLPGGHAVRLVTESRWLQLPLEVSFHVTSAQNALCKSREASACTREPGAALAKSSPKMM